MIGVSTLLVQGFPEELVFRGYIFRNLGGTLPLWATVTIRQWRAPLDWRAVPGDT